MECAVPAVKLTPPSHGISRKPIARSSSAEYSRSRPGSGILTLSAEYAPLAAGRASVWRSVYMGEGGFTDALHGASGGLMTALRIPPFSSQTSLPMPPRDQQTRLLSSGTAGSSLRVSHGRRDARHWGVAFGHDINIVKIVEDHPLASARSPAPPPPERDPQRRYQRRWG